MAELAHDSPLDPRGEYLASIDLGYLEWIISLLGRRLTDVLRTVRVAEDDSELISEEGNAKLVRAFSELGTLCQKASILDARAQARLAQRIDLHLRQAAMEAPRGLAEALMDEVGALWAELEQQDAALSEAAAGPTRQWSNQHRGTYERIDRTLSGVREMDISDSTWDEWLDAASEVAKALPRAVQLRNDLRTALSEGEHLLQEARDRAQQLHESKLGRKRHQQQIAVGIVSLVLGLFGGWILDGGFSGGGTKTVTNTVTIH
jgi:hypothetical protein